MQQVSIRFLDPISKLGRLETSKQSGVKGKKETVVQTKQMEVDWKISDQENLFNSALSNLVDFLVVYNMERVSLESITNMDNCQG